MLLKKKTENEIRECRLAQIDYCDKKGRTYFAPRDGVCFRCKRDIYQNVGWKNSSSYSKTRIEKDGEKVDSITGISLEKASSELITLSSEFLRLN
jgi:hypothetical protein